jgi:MFS family permease
LTAHALSRFGPRRIVAVKPINIDRRTSRRIGLSVLALCFVLSMLGRGALDSFGVFLLPIIADFGWDRAQVISIYSLALLTSGLSLPWVGRLFDRYGPRVVYGLGLALLGAAFALAARAKMLWQFQLCLGLAAGLGGACLGNVPNSILLVRWFGARLPTAMAVAFSGAGAGVLTLLPLSQVLIDGYGWRGAYQALGGALLLLLVPLLLLPWRVLAAGAPDIARHARPALSGEGWTLLRALRHQVFWALFCTFFFTAIGMFAISVQVVAYLVDVGFPPLQAATAWGFSGVLVLVGMLTISSLDRLIGRRPSVLLSYCVTIAGIVMLWLLGRYPNSWMLAGFVGCFGSTIGSRGPLITAEAMEIFRGERVGTIFGAISLGGGLGSALGSWSGGLLHDWSGGYNLLIGFALASVLLGMIPFLVVPALRR